MLRDVIEKLHLLRVNLCIEKMEKISRCEKQERLGRLNDKRKVRFSTSNESINSVCRFLFLGSSGYVGTAIPNAKPEADGNVNMWLGKR